MPPKNQEPTALTPVKVEALIHMIRGQRVMLDADLAELYGITTAALNQAVERNPDRFPDDFSYSLTQKEFTALISQTVTSKSGRGGRRILRDMLTPPPVPPKRPIGFHSPDNISVEKSS